MTDKQVSEETGIPYGTLRSRMDSGMTLEEAVAVGVRTHGGGRSKHVHRWHGEDMTIAELAVELGVHKDCMSKRIRKHGLHGAMTLPVDDSKRRYT